MTAKKVVKNLLLVVLVILALRIMFWPVVTLLVCALLPLLIRYILSKFEIINNGYAISVLLVLVLKIFRFMSLSTFLFSLAGILACYMYETSKKRNG